MHKKSTAFSQTLERTEGGSWDPAQGREDKQGDKKEGRDESARDHESLSTEKSFGFDQSPANQWPMGLWWRLWPGRRGQNWLLKLLSNRVQPSSLCLLGLQASWVQTSSLCLLSLQDSNIQLMSIEPSSLMKHIHHKKHIGTLFQCLTVNWPGDLLLHQQWVDLQVWRCDLWIHGY